MSTLNYQTMSVFAGSRLGNDPSYAHAAEFLGDQLGRRGINVVYGGGNLGLMGVFARAASSAGAHVTGVIPTGFIKKGEHNPHPRYSQVEVEGLFDRKKEMIFRGDGMFGLPGGVGTSDENFEGLAFNDLQKYLTPDAFVRPLILVSIKGHFEGMRVLLDKAIDSGFMDREVTKAVHWARCAEEAIDIFDDLQYRPKMRVSELMPQR